MAAQRRPGDPRNSSACARVITTNTFSANRIMLEPAGLGFRFRGLNRAAVALALEARDRTGTA